MNNKLGKVAKYNILKAVSTILSSGTPLITLLCCGNIFVQNPASSMSATAMVAILLSSLLLKDKIAEKVKLKSAFVISVIGLVLILIVENILQPMKWVLFSTMCASGIDEVTFKLFYTRLEATFPGQVDGLKMFGFLVTDSKTLFGEETEQTQTTE